MLELTTENAADYMRERGWTDGGFCQVEELAGGVSNVVFRVRTFKGLSVLKQSRPQLRTADPWFSDLSRIYREIDAMQLLEPRLPDGCVPRVLFRDDENYAFLMTHAPRDNRDWRSVLLAGDVDPKLGDLAGQLLGRIHESTRVDIEAMANLRDRTVFEQLRVEPFYRRVAARLPEIAPLLQPLIDDVTTAEICLCHGDFSPKNLLLHGDGFTLVDYETAHLGDPAFDLGFFLSHLFLKAIMLPDKLQAFRLLFAGFWRGYQDACWFKPFIALQGRGMHHLAGCLLARVDGASPAPYLDDAKRIIARSIALRLLRESVFDWDEAQAILTESL